MKTIMNIKFVDYSGEYPNLCSGILTLNIDGVNKTFGDDDDCDYDKFWITGGRTYFSGGWSKSHIEEDEWIINKGELPPALKPYSEEIADIFNDNVPHGCCGGCL